ncbi:MAG: DUF2442 domain-containing protein [Chloroflexi bacterium]|nr:DUF2442 domain-containing protein [Chloroflexota bacterium]
MTAPRIRAIKPLAEHRLHVVFVSGIQKIYDCASIMALDRFYPLRNEAFFRTVTVDAGGYGVSWNDEVDLSEYELWQNGVPCAEVPSGQVVPCGAPTLTA